MTMIFRRASGSLFGKQVPSYFERLTGGLNGGAEEFSFDVVTSNTSSGSTNSDQFKIPTHFQGTYDFNVDWGDGSDDDITVWDDPAVTHTYSSAGTFKVTITGNQFLGWSFANTGDRLKMTTLFGWGILALRAEANNFHGTANLTGNPSGTPDLSAWTRASNCFRGSGMDFSVNDWDISNLLTIDGFFQDMPNFNQPLDKWFQVGNTPVVTSFSALFATAASFNQDLNDWDVSGISNFTACFTGAAVFQSDLNNWDMSTATTIGSMFNNTQYNGDITGWDLSNCTNLSNLFFSNESFNQPIGDWTLPTTGTVTMSGTFNGATAFNQDISSWDVSRVTTFQSTFNGATAFAQDLSSWDISNATILSNMFQSTAVDFDLGSWDVTGITVANAMFLNVTLSTSNYNSLLTGWEGQAVQNNVTFSGGNSKYTDPGAPATARADLIADHTWTITDGGAA